MGLRTWLAARLARNIQGTQPITLAALTSLMQGTPAITGKTVTVDAAIGYGAFYAAVRVLSESVATLPLIVYRRTDSGRERAETNPAYYLLHNEPNPWMTACVFKELLQAHLCIYGNAYAYIEYDNATRPKALWPLRPDLTTPVYDENTLELRYKTTYRNVERWLYPWEVLHVPGLGFDGLVGYSPLQMYAKQSLALGIAAEEFGGRFFGNGAQAGGIIRHPKVLSKDAVEHLRRSFSDRHGGVENAWKPMILEEGMEWTTITIPPEQAQFLETRKFQVEEIARIFRVPPHMLGQLDKATFSNIEQQSLDFVKQSLRIWLTKWEQEVTRKLLTGPLFAEFLIDDLLRGDTASRFAAYTTGIQNGFLTIDEVRTMENRPTFGPPYDKPKPAANLFGPDQQPPPPEPPPPAQPDDEGDDQANAFRPLCEQTIRKLLTKARDRRPKSADKAWREKEAGLVVDAVSPIVTAYRGDEGAASAYAAWHVDQITTQPIDVEQAPMFVARLYELMGERHGD